MTNVFLITVDDLRADRLGLMGYQKKITDSLDQFARENVFFKQAIATGPRTTLSFPGVLFSRYSSEFFNGDKKFESLALVLKRRGYRTATFNSNPHFKSWGFSKGFDYFEDFLSETESRRTRPVEKLKKKVVDLLGRDHFVIKNLSRILSRTSSQITLPYADAKKTTEESLKWIRENSDDKLFCWIHYMDPHYPFLPPDEYLTRGVSKKEKRVANRYHKRAELYGDEVPQKIIDRLNELYDAEVKYFDRYFGRLIESLKELDLFEDSIIIFTSDHGELFGDYGLFGHQSGVLYQKQVQVPLIVKSSENESSVIDDPVSLVDIPFTITDMLGVEDHRFRGKSLLKEKREYIIGEGDNSIDEMMVSCQKDEWKLIVDEKNEKKELFNLKEDPLEKQNLYGKREISQELEEAVEDHKREVKEGSRQVLKENIEKLKASGKI